MGIHLNAGFRSPRLSMIYARDLVKILIAAAEKGERLPGIDGGHDSSGLGIYFGVGPDHPTYRELGRIIAPELVKNGSGPWNICVPGSLALLLGATNEAVCWFRGKADIFSRDKVREGLAPSWVCSCEKVRRQLSWQPSATLVDQLRATARWYVQQGWT
jgi:nucleoside-diphosphate-sugar epimerase